METLNSICKKDGRYREVIKECYLVKNAVSLLGGRRKKKGERDGKEEAEGEEGGVGERKEREKKRNEEWKKNVLR